jgi:hypothetical protein
MKEERDTAIKSQVKKKQSPLALAAWGLQPKPYHNWTKELPD